MNYFNHREMEQIQPSGYAEYMSNYGEHFSKKMCQWAVSRMRNSDGKKITPLTKEKVDEMLSKHGVSLDNDNGYDKVYVANMCMADFMGSSVPDEAHLALYVKDLLDDPDGYDGLVFNRFIMDCLGMGVPVIWEDMI
jgi:hypothetical protein